MHEISFHNVKKRYGKITALDGVSFDIEKGEYVTVLGPTGSGKTTVLKLLAGLIEPDEGEVRFKDKRVNELRPEERDVGLVFQNFMLFPHLNVWENVTFGPHMRGWTSEKTDKLGRHMLDLVHLFNRASSYPNELSGGMQQRIALARTLTPGSKIMLMDEPLGALDARLRVELRYELVRLMKGLGITTVHVTHDQEEAMTISDKIMVLRRGKIEQIGAPMELFLRPRSIFVANFVGESNIIEGIIREIKNGFLKVELKDGLTVVVPSVDGAVLGERIVIALKPENVSIQKGVTKGINHIQGVIERRSFLGTFAKYSARLETGDLVNSKVLALQKDKTLEMGDKTTVSFRSNEAVVYHHPKDGVRRELEVE